VKISTLFSLLGTCCFGLLGLYHQEFLALVRLDFARAAPQSVADKYCADKWVANARNDPALTCYLTSHTDRLCKPGEREHLAHIVQRYLLDQERFSRQLAISLAGVQMRVNSRQDGDIETRLGDAYKAEAKRLKENGIDKAVKVKATKDEDLTALLRGLAVKGLVAETDFGWSPPPFVAKAFEGLGQHGSVCAKPSA
jgi:hypothetical protein